VTMELLDALAAAHARGFVHRDLKPENVFLAEPGAAVKLLDFGIAKAFAGGNQTSLPGTAAGVLLGTLAYMAPEQLADAAGVDPRADLWAMGVMVYEMLSGRLPYNATTVEQMFVKLAKEQPDPIRAYLPSVAPAIEAFFARALARDPRTRFASAIEMAGAFAQLPIVSDAPPPIATPTGGMATAATGFGVTGYALSPSEVGQLSRARSAATPAAQSIVTPAGGSPMLPPVVTPSGGSPMLQPLPPLPPTPLPAAQHAMTPGALPVAGHVMTPHTPVPAASSSVVAPVDRGRVLGFALAGVAAIIIVVAIVIATRGGNDKPKGGRTDLVIGKTDDVADAQVKAPEPQPQPPPPPPPQPQVRQPVVKPKVPPDARLPDPPKPDARQPEIKQPDLQPQQPYPDPPPKQPFDCEQGCKFLAGCGMRAPDCLVKCKADFYEGCLPQTSCAGFAKCYINSNDGCSGTITGKGTASCADVWNCQASSCRPGDRICGCRCAANIAYAKIPPLLVLDGCVTANQTRPNNEIVANCAAYINACIRQ